MVLRVLQTGGGEACTNQCSWMRETERCGWVRKAKQSGLAGRSGGLAGRSRGLAGRSGGLAEPERQQSFVERQSFWVFPLHHLYFFSAPLILKSIDIDNGKDLFLTERVLDSPYLKSYLLYPPMILPSCLCPLVHSYGGSSKPSTCYALANSSRLVAACHQCEMLHA